jgi:hypothetical protein
MNAIKRFMKIYLSYYGHNSLEISLLGGPLEKKTNNLALAPRQSKELFEPVAAYDIAQIRHNCIRALMSRTTTKKKEPLQPLQNAYSFVYPFEECFERLQIPKS